MRALLAQECRALAPELARVQSGRALLFDVVGMPELAVPACRGVHLRVDRHGGLGGDLRAHGAALPFADRSMDLLLLRHVGELVDDPRALATDALRVLAGDGLVVITGIHPCSLWHPWLRRRAALASQRVRPILPGRWRTWLAEAGTEVRTVMRFGPSKPGSATARFQGAGLLAAGYIVIGRKRRQPPAVLRMIKPPRRMPMGEAMPGAARRECA